MNKVYTSSILKRLQLLLGAEGFRRSGTHFLREAVDVKQTISLQKSTTSTNDILVSTINLCVFSKVLVERLLEVGEVSFPSDCHWSDRLSVPISSTPQRNSEKWWVVENVSQADEAASEMVDLLIRYGLPALHKVSSTEKLLEFWSSGKCQGITEAARSKYVAVLTGHGKNETAVRDEKLAELYRAVTLHPGDSHCRLQLAIALSENLQLDEAIAHLEEAVRIDEGDAQVHFHLGKAYGLPQARRAISEFRKSLAIDPDDPNTHFELATAFAYVSDTEAAIIEYKQTLRLDPHHRDANFGLVNCLLVLGREAEASAIHRKFIEQNGYG